MYINENLNKEIIEINKKIDKELSQKMREYANCQNYSERDFYCELAFCILTPQSKALNAWKIIETIRDNGFLFNASADELSNYLNTVRFKNTKAKRLVKLRKLMTIDGELSSKKILLSMKNEKEIRKWILENIDGMGLKEASHFLRNIGKGESLAILDRHILRVLKDLNVIDEIPKTLNYKKYLEIEEKMCEYAKRVNINMARLDLVLWYRQVSYIFK